ncbi:MAG: transposase [Patescibacteria group bacterium]
MPRAIIAPGEHYHIFNRGFEKRNIFLNVADYMRMSLLIMFLQGTTPIRNIGRLTKILKSDNRFNAMHPEIESVLDERSVELCAFVLMPNHFHLLAHELKEGAISSYLQRIEIAYTKYFNIKRDRSGYLLQGPFQSVHVNTNEQLLYLSAYIHRNPRELKVWANKELHYPWSSYQDTLVKNRWGQLLKHEIISAQFSGPKEYRNFVETSGAKEIFQGLHLD